MDVLARLAAEAGCRFTKVAFSGTEADPGDEERPMLCTGRES